MSWLGQVRFECRDDAALLGKLDNGSLVDFPGTRTYIPTMFKQSYSVVAIALMSVQPAAAQRGAIAIEQISSRPAAATAVRVAPVRGAKSSTVVQETPREGGAAPAIAPEVIEACRKAQAEDRPAPEGVDCLAAAEALGQAPAQTTAEAALLPLFGQNSNVTGAPAGPVAGSADADAVARQLSTGGVQAGGANGAAAIIGRERAAPPPNAPR